MKNPIGNLNKVFDSRIRMGVMSMLLMNEEISFNDLKQLLELTDGTSPRTLLILRRTPSSKFTRGLSVERRIRPTRLPRRERRPFKDHLEALENMIKGMHKPG